MDTREGGKNYQSMYNKLMTASGGRVMRLALPVGDYLFAVEDTLGEMSTASIMCDYVIERKEVHDLVSSVTSGRHGVQKQKMLHCGITNRMYIMEGLTTPLDDWARGHKDTILKARCETTVDGFTVLDTMDLDDTVGHIAGMRDVIQSMLASGGVESVLTPLDLLGKRLTVEKFIINCKKDNRLTVGELFKNQLFAATGVGRKSVAAVSKVYGTPAVLLDAFDAVAVKGGETASVLSAIGVPSKAAVSGLDELYNCRERNYKS